MELKNLNPKISLQEFNELEKTSDEPLEYINGYVYARSFSSMVHNKIVTRINGEIDRFLRGKPCQVFSEQIEVILGENRVKPDVFVVCKEKNEFRKVGQSFLTIPKIVFEVVSPSNASLDTIVKMDMYAKFGIKEYNLVYQDGRIYKYILNEVGDYYCESDYRKGEKYVSSAIMGLSIDTSFVFDDLEF